MLLSNSLRRYDFTSQWPCVRRFLIATAALSAALLALGGEPALGTFPGKPGKLVFQRHLGGGLCDVAVANPDGTDVRTLAGSFSCTDPPAMLTFIQLAPAWSADGSKIAFGGDGVIYVMNADGSGLTAVTGAGGGNYEPTWSPDDRIAFVSTRDGNAEIYVMNADGTEQTRLTHNEVEDKSPDWSPKGDKIAFMHQVGISFEIYVVAPDGTGERSLSYGNDLASLIPFPPVTFHPPGDRRDYYPEWSPDGEKIAFTGEAINALDPGEILLVFVMNADGSDRIALRYMNFAPGGIAGDGPVWSPDGAEIVYSTYELELLFTNLKGELLRAFVAPFSLSFLPGTLDWQAAVPPANRTVPTISGGDFEVGEQAFATTGTWFATPPLTLDIQWQRCLTSGGRERCSDIPRASSETYTIGTRDRCRRLRVVVTASNSLGSATAISEPTPRIGPLGNCA